MMKFTRRLLVFAGAVTLCAGLLSSNAPVLAQSADEAGVAAAVEGLRKAMVDADKQELESFVADQLSYGHSSGRVQNKAQYIDELVSKKSVFKSITLSDQTIAIAGNDAVVRHTFAGDLEAAGKITPIKIGVLQVWQKNGAEWKLMARQGFGLK